MRSFNGFFGCIALALSTACAEEIRRPIADGGADLSINTGTVAFLDASESRDPDGRLLTFAWRLRSAPAGSTAALNDPTLVRPSFTPDITGEFALALRVFNGVEWSREDDVVVAVGSGAPIAVVAQPSSVNTGTPVVLSGAQSSDPDGHLLSFEWSFAALPAGSSSVLTGPNTVNPSFVPDRSGEYAVSLVVHDGSFGNRSAPVVVTIAVGDGKPTAVISPAGAFTAQAGAVVSLDGGQSSDADDHLLHYSWSFVSLPSGSEARLNDPQAIAPSFVADLPGDYLVALVVDDGPHGNVSVPVTKVVTAGPCFPVATIADDSATIVEGESVRLTSASTSPCGRALAPVWQLVSAPVGSAVTLSSLDGGATNFTADVPGSYVIRLSVADTAGIRDPDGATIMVSAAPRRVDVADTGLHSSLALRGASQQPALAYYDATDGDLKYASLEGAEWRTEAVDLGGDVGQYPSLAFTPDAAAHPRIAYHDVGANDLKYAERDATGLWTRLTVDAGDPRAGRYASLALDAVTGKPRIVYQARTGGDDVLKLAFCDADDCLQASGWTSKVLVRESGKSLGGAARFALAGGVPRFSYYHRNDRDLFFGACADATCGTGAITSGVTIRRVDSLGDVGSEADLALGPTGNPRIAYYDATNGNALLARCGDDQSPLDCTAADAVWTIQTLETTGDTGRQPSIAADPLSGALRIVWQDRSRKVARHAVETPDGWTFRDLAGAVGDSDRGLSLRLSAAGSPRVVFYGDAVLRASFHQRGN